jgi:hypothetical protein
VSGPHCPPNGNASALDESAVGWSTLRAVHGSSAVEAAAGSTRTSSLGSGFVSGSD